MLQLYPWQRPYAEQMCAVLASHDLVINTMGTGTGKTYLATETARALDRPMLVVAPKVSLTNWKRVAASMGCEKYLAGVINPERISLGRSPWYDGTKWHVESVGIVCWDEIHKGASGYDSKATLAAARLKRLPVKKILMSATVADSPVKMRALGYLLGLHDFSLAEYRAWAMKHGCFWDLSGLHPIFRFTKDWASALAHMTAIHEQIKDRLVGCRIQNIPGFPPTMIGSALYDLDTVCRQEVNAAYAEMSERMKTPGKSDLTVRLRARERAEFAKCGLLASLVQDLLDEDRSAVVFMCFRSSLARLADKLKELGILDVVQIHGDQNESQRQAAIDAFQSNQARVMLSMIQAGGVAVSLHDVTHTRPRDSLITPSDNAAEVKQALGRIQRVGGTPTTQRFVLAAGTIEEKIHQNIQFKAGNIACLQDGDLTCPTS